MENGRFTLHHRVVSALSVLAPAEQKAIRAKLSKLAEVPLKHWPRWGATRISAEEPLYMARVDDSLRIILRAGEGEPPEAQDIVRHETLQWFRRAEDPAHA
jgi:hypothetical protein